MESKPAPRAVSALSKALTQWRGVIHVVRVSDSAPALFIVDKDPHVGSGFPGKLCISGQNFRAVAIIGANQCCGMLSSTTLTLNTPQPNLMMLGIHPLLPFPF